MTPILVCENVCILPIATYVCVERNKYVSSER
jgi:hypothetical protein